RVARGDSVEPVTAPTPEPSMSRLPSLRAPLALCAVLGLVGCDDEPEPTDAGLDAAVADAGVDGGPSRSALCDELGLPVRAFDSGATSAAFEQLAGDFTV